MECSFLINRFLRIISYFIILSILLLGCNKKIEFHKTNAKQVSNQEVLFANSETIEFLV